MGIEPKVSHAQSKLGTIKPREHLVWTSLYVPYKIYICEYCITISQLQNSLLFISVSIKNIVDMSGNKQFVKTRAQCTPSQPPSHVAVTKTRYATRRGAQ